MRCAALAATLLFAAPACGGDGAAAIDAGLEPDAAVPPGPTRYPHDAITSPITAAVAERLRAIAAAGPAQRGDVFMKVGASGTVSRHLLYCFAGPPYEPGFQVELDGRVALEPALAHFRGGLIGADTPFDRDTLAAESGRTARWVITGAPSPLARELAATTPRYAVVNYGTNDMEAAASYGAALAPFWASMSTLLDELLAAGVVPILTGLNPRTDDATAARWVATYDVLTRALAEAYQVPYLSLYQASTPLVDQGLGPDGLHGNVYVDGTAQPCVFTADGLAWNYNRRNLETLTLLDASWRAVDDLAPPLVAPPLPPVVGDGTAAAPFVIDRLPFSHSFTTVDGERVRAGYPGCDAGQDESGPEISYRLDLPAATAVRAVVLARAPIDVDLHVVTGDACVERHDAWIDRALPAGAHTLVVDSFVAGGQERAGAYTLVVLPCAAGDPDC